MPWLALCVLVLLTAVIVQALIPDDALEQTPASPAVTEAPVEAAVGPREYSPEACDRQVLPDDDAAAVVEDEAPGTTICFTRGVHRLSEPLVPRDRQQLLGEPGAVLSGAKVLTDWQRDDGLWFVEDQTQRLQRRGDDRCDEDHPRCDRSENVFVDGAWVRHVDDLDDVESDTYHFEYGEDRIWVGMDPSQHDVEAVVTGYAIVSDADDVTISGLTIQMFGNPAQEGAIQVEGEGWLIEDNVVQLNHGVGIRTDDEDAVGNVIRRNRIVHQGQLGIGGYGIDMLIEANEIAYNNQAGFAGGWEAGASKWVRTEGLVVRDNHAHDNLGHGLWTDIDNVRTLYEGNRSERNERSGIFHEISYDAIIRDNVVIDNGTERFGWATGSGIRIANSSDVEVTGNRVSGNGNGIVLSMQDRGEGDHGLWELRDVHVHDNLIIMTTGYTGLVQDVGDTDYYDDAGNRFSANRYEVPHAGSWWTWHGAEVTFPEWQEHGNDTTGAVRVLEGG